MVTNDIHEPRSVALPNLPYLRRSLWRAVTGHSPDLRSMATRRWELCPAERGRVPAALSPAGSLERVTGLSPWGHWAEELALVRGDVIEHAATVMYEVSDAVLRGPVVYRGAAKEHAGHGPERLLRDAAERCVDLQTAHLVSSHGGSTYFGMYMRADLPLALLVEDPTQRLGLPTKPYPHAEGYRHLLGIEAPPIPSYARIRRLFVYTDYGHNASKAGRFERLRAHLRATLGDALAEGAAPGVYIRRGATDGQRALRNEAAIEALLRGGGFRIVDPSLTSAEGLARECLGARVIVAVEGSHLAHGIYSACDGATFIVLQPPDRFSMAFKAYTDRMNMRFAFVVGDATPEGFTIRLGELESVLACVTT